MSESREELEKGFEKELSKDNNKSFKERIKDFVCKIGIHFWKVNAIGKKKGKVVKLKKCEHCGMMK